MSEADTVSKIDMPRTRDSLAAELRALGLAAGPAILRIRFVKFIMHPWQTKF